MDKKSIIIGLLFLVAGFLLMSWNGMRESKARQERLLQQAEEQQRSLEESAWEDRSSGQEASPSAPTRTPEISPVTPVDPRPLPSEVPEEVRIRLANAEIEVTFSTHGGAIENIVLKNYPADNPHTTESPRPVVLNRHSDRPALALSRSSGSELAPLARFYRLVSQTADSVTFETVLPDGLVVERHYALSNGGASTGPEPYTVEHRTIFRNTGPASVQLDRVFFNLGAAAPTDADYMGFNLNASYYIDGDYDTIPASKFTGGGFIFKRQPREQVADQGYIEWGSVKNQFFATIFTPEPAAQGIVARGLRFPQDPATREIPMGITAALEFGVPVLESGAESVISGGFYVGPKSFDRLSQMGRNQEDVMQLGWFLGFFLGLVAFVSKALLTLMGGIHGIMGNWGVAIILTTFVIRLCLWPLTAKAARASKRMQKLQKPLQELREKYQDNPQKMNQEIMTLWKKHKINPLSGCWPVLVQFPIFIAFFNLLRNSSDLRFAEFLWIHDLSMPDATIPLPVENGLPLVGAAINVLPFIWVVSMYFQMKMMPQPSIDNAQARIIKWMPFIFFPFTYYFSSGLVLYWTTTNCFSIFQQWMTNRKRDEEDIAIEEEIAEMSEDKKRKLPSGPLISKKKKSRRKGGSSRP